MAPSDPSATRVWLEESAWVQRLARRLVRESSQAEDLAQEALRVALERPPAASVPFRSWLGGVVRNLARVARRGDARRHERELATARSEAIEGSVRLAERLELQERLVAAVRGLEEPYRTTVALRYLEDLSTQDVAARLNVPVKTVHTRLERALAQLRERLDREHGSRSAWAGLLVPLSVPTPPPPAPLELAGPAVTLPLVAMGTATKWTAAAVTVAALGFFAFRSFGGSSPRAAPPVPAAIPAESSALLAPRAESTPVSSATVRREVADTSAAGSPETSVPEPPQAGPLVVGFVLDLAHQPVGGLEVRYEGIELGPGSAPPTPLPGTTTSAADGRFELPFGDGAARIVATGAGYATVRAPILAGPLPPEPLLVFVGPAREYAGRVLDPDGQPIAGAEVAVYLAEGLADELTSSTLAASMAAARTTSDLAGHFALILGSAEGSRLKAGAEGFRSAELALPALSRLDLELTLAPLAPEHGLYAGRVLHADGRPAAGAYVATGEDSVRTDEAGHFRLTPGPHEQPTHLRAALRGYLPAELVLAEVRPDQREALELVLGGPGLTIAGHVRDADGSALAGVRIWTDDGERFGSVLTRIGDVSISPHYDVEGMIDGVEDGQKDGRDVRSADDGSFELTGLVARRYRLWALHPLTFERLGPLEIAAGARGVELVLAGRERMARVAGRVTNYTGAPLAGVSVRVARQYRSDAGSVREHRDYAQAHLTTDAEGRFEFPALCVDGTLLQFIAPDATSETPLELAGLADLEHIELALPAVCHLRVELDEPARADSLELEDAAGQSLDLTFQLGGLLFSSAGVQLFEGRSELITTDESAVTLVLRKDGVELERHTVRLEPGRLNELFF